MFARIETIFRRLRRRLSRREWAIRHLGLAPSEGTSEAPGLLLVQIDGLSRAQLERAIDGGRMPFLRRLLRREGYALGTFYPGLPSSTPAVQAELFYGVRAAVPAFSYYDRTKRRHGLMFEPDWVKETEDALAAQNEGLLTGGSSWSNIYTGGAAQEESHFCAASLGMRDLWRSGGVRNFFFFLLFHFPSAMLIAVLILFELLLASVDALAGVLRGEKLRLELQLAVSRALVATGLREFIATMAAIDLARGLPIVHVNFVGYDEHAHRRGPGSGLAHLSLRGIDWAIKRLYRAADRSARRDYAVWIYSDHGQERTTPFGRDPAKGVEQTIREALELAQAHEPTWRPRSQQRPVMPWLGRRSRRARGYAATAALTAEEQATFTVAAVGPVGHLYFAHPTAPERIQSLARLLVTRHGVPGVLWREADGSVRWTHPHGEAHVPDGLATLLPHPEPMRTEIARDLLALAKTTHAGDLVLLGWAPGQPPRSFAIERGAHGGPGPEETRGFTLLPLRTRLPAGSEHHLRPAAMRAAALHFLDRGPLEVPERVPASGDRLTLRVMTYNTHSCGGTDGRVSPRRIARVIGAQSPDIVALQELDLGHRRSRAEDQAQLIAEALEFHVVFCPTVTRGEEHYGHALLCRWPIEIVRRAFLPTVPGGWWPEPRSALWARVSLGARRINVITTHLGLGVRERVLQMQALLGPEWIGAIPPEEDAILCGDFNAMPGSAPYRLAANRLRDVQHVLAGHTPRRTFSSFQPFTRIDHIFISESLVPQQILVPRNELTRVASDHLPLVADLATAPAAVETPTHTPATP